MSGITIGLIASSVINLVGLIFLLKRKRSIKIVQYEGGIAWYDTKDNLINSTTKI